MKSKISWIYFLTYFFLINIGGSNVSSADVPEPGTKPLNTIVEDDFKLSKNEDTDDFSREIQPFRGLLGVAKPGLPVLIESKENRELRSKTSRRRKAAKKKAKALKKSKKGKKSKGSGKDNDDAKMSKAERKREKKLRKKQKKLEKKARLEAEKASLDEESPFSEFPELDDSLDQSDSDVDDSDLSSTLDSSDEDVSLEPLDSTTTGDLGSYRKGKKYWDSGTMEPEYIISEWFAILDGKKFDRKSGFKSPYITNDESQYGTDYLLNKKKNSKYLTNKYSSGWKYANGDNDSMDYVTPIYVSEELLRRTFPDTKEDEVENRIINNKFRDNQKQFTNNRELKTYNSNFNSNSNKNNSKKNRRRGRSRRGSYDLINDYREDPSEVRGTYRKLDDSEIENYPPYVPVDDAIPIHIDEPESTEDDDNTLNDLKEKQILENEENELKELEEQLREERNNDADDVNHEIPLDDSPVMVNPTEKLEEVKEASDYLDTKLDDLDVLEEREKEKEKDNHDLTFDDYDFEEPRVRNSRLRSDRDGLYDDKQIKNLSKKKCQKELKKLKNKHRKIMKEIREKASE